MKANPGKTAALTALRSAGVLVPRVLTLAVTGVCNLKCGHCWPESGGTASPGHLPASTLLRLLSEFAGLGGDGVVFTGGEPLCHPDWVQLLRSARSLGFGSVAIQTNGMLWTDALVDDLRSLDFPRLEIQVSLDGATAASHDRVRGDNAFAEALAGVRRLVQGGLGRCLRLNFTEMKHNLAEFPALLSLASELGIGSVVGGTLVRRGRAIDVSGLMPPDPDDYRQLRRTLDGDPRLSGLYARIGTMAAMEWGRETGMRTGFCTFAEHPYLSAAGNLYPCVLCQDDRWMVEGMLKKTLSTALAEAAPLWGDLKRESIRRSRELDTCRGCPGEKFCAGGCMGRGLAQTGSCRSVDDRCATRNSIYREMLSLVGRS